MHPPIAIRQKSTLSCENLGKSATADLPRDWLAWDMVLAR